MNKSLLEKLLEYYSLSYQDYLSLNKEVTLENFDNGHHFKQIEEAAILTRSVMNSHGSILVYGDYDADGIMGTSILVKMFHYLDYQADYYIPNRYVDGYGITLEHAREYVKNKISLVITVDNGVTAFEPIKYLKDNGVKVIVLDHHTREENLPEADYIIHPLISEFGDVASSGGFVAFMFSRALLGRSDKYLSTLASISLISDIMPLQEYNRFLLKTVFRNYQIGEFLPIDLLADKEGFDENIIASKIAPRINAVGRMKEDDSANKLVEYFLNENQDFILNYFKEICAINEERKTYTKNLLENTSVNLYESGIVIKVDAKEGLIGLLAGSFTNSYKKPAVIFAMSKDKDILKGSARSIPGFNIMDAFKKLDKYFITYGGHALAAGCSIKASDFDAFYTEFNHLVSQSNIESPVEKTIAISINDINKENFELIKSFSPFGEGFPAPILLLERIKVNALRYSKTYEHIMTNIGFGTRIVGFNLSKNHMSQYSYVNMSGTLKYSTFNGYTNVDFVIKDIHPLD